MGATESEILWSDCTVPEGLSDAVSMVTAYGRASARGCRLGVRVPSTRQAVDFDLNWRHSVLAGSTFAVKRQILCMATQVVPSNGSNERTLLLPKDAKVVGVYVRKPASGASSTAYQIHAGNGDKTVTHASSTSATGEFKDAHLIAAGMTSTPPL